MSKTKAVPSLPKKGARELPQNPSSRSLDKVRELVQILESSSLAELSYEDADIAVKIARAAAPVAHASPAPMVIAAPAAAQTAPATPIAAPRLVEDDDKSHVIRSPFVGTFYGAASPESAPFTDVGKEVRQGQTLCIIEAMKLMNEIECDVNGKVLAVLVENGRAVQFNEPLFKIAVKK